MSRVLEMVGLIALAILVIMIVKKIDNYYFDKSIGTELSDKIYKAATAFSEGGSLDEIRSILLNCLDLDEEDIDEILLLSSPHIADNDCGYNAFIKAAKKTLKNY